MSNSIDSLRDLDVTVPEVHQNVCSPASSYSTYSREIKYIFSPVNAGREYQDYSHINPQTKQNYLSHTPRTLSAASQLSSKGSRTPHTSREEHVLEALHYVPLQVAVSDISSVLSKEKKTGSPNVEAEIYSSTHGHGSHKPDAHLDHGGRSSTHFSHGNDTSSHPLIRHSYSAVQNNMLVSAHPQNTQRPTHVQYNFHNKQTRQSEVRSGSNTIYKQPQNNHSFHHYQQPAFHHSVASGSMPPQEPFNPSHEQASQMQFRYNSHQHHSRRKTWSPPALKLSLLTPNCQGSRVCYSNDSLDVANEGSMERKAQSLSEDLDTTPPKLAPVSGVLAQKPGQNLIKPIAFKPVHASSPLSPDRVMTRQLGTDGHMNGSFDMTRPHSLKLGNGILNTQGSSDSHIGRKYELSGDPVTKFHRQSSDGRSSLASINSPHAADINHHHSQTSYSLTASEDSLHNSLQHSSSNSSSHVGAGSAYNNIPISSHASVNSVYLPITDEPSIPRSCLSERPDSIPSLTANHVLFHPVESMHQTPSPSDSGVGELEAMLREKDSEINTLREVMERNEHAIFQVYEERRNVWLRETQEIQNEYERRLKVQNRKSYKTEQVLSLQVYKLQQEQKTLQEEKAYEKTFINDECPQPKDITASRDCSTQTIVNEAAAASEDMRSSLLAERNQIIVDLQEEIMQIQMQVALLKEEREKEQEQWLDEKNKVIRYQKQLQLNYVQMQRKNAALEREVQQLTLELERT
ncbi:unnamed protein product [Candidula unifasciata]|uniref:Uncharacterized protein n=1 Tax=Candidula unifasciata TaxID=100452 RepID=A0A8S3ZXZ2_9EUPU|nr:unnamed protein product [Candidula unifasciata]